MDGKSEPFFRLQLEQLVIFRPIQSEMLILAELDSWIPLISGRNRRISVQKSLYYPDWQNFNEWHCDFYIFSGKY